MSHALLLRLFLAPSFFSVHVALQYLKTYPDNIGITHYLTGRLREFDLKELEDVWGFIWLVFLSCRRLSWLDTSYAVICLLHARPNQQPWRFL